MIESLAQLFKNKLTTVALSVISVALALYLIGFRVLFIPAALFAMVACLPFPRILSSITSRTIASFFLLYGVLELAASLQFLVLPKSGFRTLAVVTAIFMAVILLVIARRPSVILRTAIFDRKDTIAIGAALVFVLPFIIFFYGQNGLGHTARIGSIQAIDSISHFSLITESDRAGHLNYKAGYYYPKGFHLSTAFIQQSSHLDQSNLSWTANSRLFIGEYLFYGALLIYILVYLCYMLVDDFAKLASRFSLTFLIALCLIAPITLFLLIPFIYNGFLSYLYILAAILCACIYIHSGYQEVSTGSSRSLLANQRSRWLLAGYGLLIFGASMSWPLFVPALLLIPVLYLVPKAGEWKSALKSYLSVSGLVLLAGLLIELLPVYFQLKYTSPSSGLGLNLTGGIRTFPSGVIIAGLILMAYWLMSTKVTPIAKQFINNIFVPFYILLIVIILAQYFTVGEIRYYAIKTAYLIELLLLTTVVAWLVVQRAEAKFTDLRFYFSLPLLIFFTMLLLLGLNDNPLKDTRSLLRDYSHEPKPTFFDQDVTKFTELGESGKIKHANATLLHYDAEKQKFYAHMQIPYWSNDMTYNASPQDFLALQCNGQLYGNLNFGTFTDQEQALAVKIVRQCAAMAKKHGLIYYIVSDSASAPRVKNLFGDVAVVI